LADDFSNTVLQFTAKNLEAVFGDPNHMIAMIENAVFACVVLHDHTLQKNEP